MGAQGPVMPWGGYEIVRSVLCNVLTMHFLFVFIGIDTRTQHCSLD